MSEQLRLDGGLVPPPADHVATTFRGLCEVCPWEGQDRANNLTALNDYERHVLTEGHLAAVLAATAAPDEDFEGCELGDPGCTLDHADMIGATEEVHL